MPDEISTSEIAVLLNPQMASGTLATDSFQTTSIIILHYGDTTTAATTEIQDFNLTNTEIIRDNNIIPPQISQFMSELTDTQILTVIALILLGIFIISLFDLLRRHTSKDKWT